MARIDLSWIDPYIAAHPSYSCKNLALLVQREKKAMCVRLRKIAPNISIEEYICGKRGENGSN